MRATPAHWTIGKAVSISNGNNHDIVDVEDIEYEQIPQAEYDNIPHCVAVM